MSMLAPSRGSGTTGLLEQPPAHSLTPDQNPAGAEIAPRHPSSLKSRTTMTTTESDRRIVAPATVVPPDQPAPPVVEPTPPQRAVRPRFARVRGFLFGVGDDSVDITTVQREALRQPYLR
ncbi:MAG: hypothetical protein QM804_13600 [Propionicimonas sp.]